MLIFFPEFLAREWETLFTPVTDLAPTPKNDDPQKKIQPSSSNMQPQSYPEGGSIGN